MFVLLCSSVCFRNVGCCHVPVLGPVAFAQGSKKKYPDREASLIKKEYCRLSASPHSLQVTPHLELVLTC